MNKNEKDYTTLINPPNQFLTVDPIETHPLPHSEIDSINRMATRLKAMGGPSQQSRMIRDKRRSLDRALLYSYQSFFVRKENETKQYRALINPNKLKLDYDDKILSIGYESGFKNGDVFEWIGTGTYWLVFLQDLNETAYFRSEIRRCSYEIEWQDGDEVKKTRAAIRGPVETKIDYIQKHGISVDNPNYSLHILMPLNEDTKKAFQRYSKFYLQNDPACWRVEAVDYISAPDILEVTAVEYYANETEDDIEQGIVGGLVVKPVDPNPPTNIIEGETFIKPKSTYSYKFNGDTTSGSWYIDETLPIEFNINNDIITIKWLSTRSGQFELQYGNSKKTIIIESLF